MISIPVCQPGGFQNLHYNDGKSINIFWWHTVTLFGDAIWCAFKILKLFLLKWISQWTKNNRENLDRNDHFWWQNGDKFWTKSVNNISQLSPSAFVKIEIVDKTDTVYTDIDDNFELMAWQGWQFGCHQHRWFLCYNDLDDLKLATV